MIVARFRRRNDAEAHLQTLRRLAPTQRYDLIFDPTHDSATDEPTYKD